LLSPEQIMEIDAAVRGGVTLKRALGINGVTPAQWRKIKAGACDPTHADYNVYHPFVIGMRKAEAEVETKLVKTILDSRDWRAAKQMLQARNPEDWADKLQIEVNKEIEHIIDVAEKVLPEEQFERLLQALSGDSPAEVGAPAEQAPVVH